MIVSNLHGNDKVHVLPVHEHLRELTSASTAHKAYMGMQMHLALCCKAMLHVLSMGNVVVRLGKPIGARPLLQLNRCLAKQPNGVQHLAIMSSGKVWGTRQLMDLRCAPGLSQRRSSLFCRLALSANAHIAEQSTT